jgi:zinc ribbon protein
MVIHCTSCGTELPDGAAYCWKCGKPQGGANTSGSPLQRWEYKDLVIEFPKQEFSRIGTDDKHYYAVVERGNAFILAALQTESRDGWQADGTTDFKTLHRNGRIKTHDTFSLLDSSMSKTTYERVTIRLKRLVRS